MLDIKGMIYVKLYDQLVEIVTKENVTLDKPLKNHTYTRLGGNADYFVTPGTYEQAAAIVRLAKADDIPFMLLGNGSNLIIQDGGIRGIVMYLGELKKITVSSEKIVAQSGALIAEVSKQALASHLTGLEFACGIPGSVGGALFMNAGAYGGEIKDVLVQATVVDGEGQIKTVSAEDLELSYRTSIIQSNEFIVLEAEFSLTAGNYEEIKAKMDVLTYKRESKQPLEYPTCGSVFKRPQGHFAGKLIQDSELQGVQIGGAQVSLKHAGFIINRDEATAGEYIALIEHVQKVVKERFNIDLEREVRIIGENER